MTSPFPHAATPRHRKPRPLEKALGSRLLAYAAMAGASVGLGHSLADAQVVYTPTHHNIDQDYYLDLNHDGINDFHIHSYYLSGYGDLEVFPVITGNRIAALAKGCLGGEAAAPLALGATIGPGMLLGAKASCMAVMDSFYSFGPWINKQNHYLGFAFEVNGQTHYGWARMSMQGFFCFPCIGRIFGYAYETTPGKSIVAGDEGHGTQASTQDSAAPTPLGALALGAPGLQLWRKRDAQ
jgi:hypothetical protein